MKRILAFIMAVSLVFSMQTVFAEQEKTEKDSAALSMAEKESVLSSLYEAELSYIRKMIDEGFVTCRELTEYYLERIEDYNVEYNCFITICDDAVMKAAQRDRQLASGEAEGALFGIPVVVQDNMDMAGYYTTGGYDREDFMVADGNSDVVERLQQEGAVIIGKTNMSTGGDSDRISYSEAVGETKNAYNTLLASGGASGGAAASVSLNFTAAGIGTDAGSSLRIPAALNGCVSLRSSNGIVPTEGIITEDDREVVGAMTRTVYDQAIMMDVLTEGAYGFAEDLDTDALENVRIGILSELTYPPEVQGEGNVERADAQVAEAFENAVKEMEDCGAEIVTVTMPGIRERSEAAVENGSAELMEQLYADFEAMVMEEDLEAVIFPAYLSAPLKSGVDEAGRYWDAEEQVYVNNCDVLSSAANLPEITVPIGNHSLGAGIGMEIAALRGDEGLLLDLAYSYTSAYAHRTTPQGAPDLYESAKPFSMQKDSEPTGWKYMGNALLICGIAAAIVIIAAHKFVRKGSRVAKRKKGERKRNASVDKKKNVSIERKRRYSQRDGRRI